MARSCCALFLASFSLVTACQGMQEAPHHRRIKFTPEMDNALRQAVEEVGTGDWRRTTSVYARILGYRNTDPGHNEIRRCRERWKHYLSAPETKQPWTEEEDSLLIAKAQELGQKWTKISTFLEGRSDIAVKNRFFVLLQNPQHIHKLASVKRNLRPTRMPTLTTQPANPIPPLAAVASQPLPQEVKGPPFLAPNTAFAPAPSLISIESAPIFSHSTFNNPLFFNAPPFQSQLNYVQPTGIPAFPSFPHQQATRIQEKTCQQPILGSPASVSKNLTEEERPTFALQRPAEPLTEAIQQVPINNLSSREERQPALTFHGPSELPTETIPPSPLPSLATHQDATEEDPQEDIMTWFDQILQESRQSNQNSLSHDIDTHSTYSYNVVDPLAYQIETDGFSDSPGILSPLRITTDSGKSDDESGAY